MNAISTARRLGLLIFVAYLSCTCVAKGETETAQEGLLLCIVQKEPASGGTSLEGVWVPVAPDAREEVSGISDLAVREAQGVLELLVFEDRCQLDRSDIKETRDHFGPMETPGLLLVLTDQGREKLRQFTKGRSGECMVEVLEGEAIQASRIHPSGWEGLVVPGWAGSRLRASLSDIPYVRFEDTCANGIIIERWQLGVLVVVLLVAAVAAVPRPKLPPPGHRRRWMLSLALVGLAAGAYYAGDSERIEYSDGPDGTPVIIIAHYISLLKGALGGIIGLVVGGVVGFLAERAFRRVRCLLHKTGAPSAESPSQ